MVIHLVKVEGITSWPQFTRLVMARYSQARVQIGSHTATGQVVIPGGPGHFWGVQDFFISLGRSQVIRSFEHKQYSDWNEEVRR